MAASPPSDDLPIPSLVALVETIQPSHLLLATLPCTIGRASGCTILIARPNVSRLHATIDRDGPRFILIDADSANGTYVNGQRLTGPHRLTSGDTIGCADPAPLLRFVDPDRTVVPLGRLSFDAQRLRFILDGEVLDLTPTQFRLLRHFYQHVGQVCSRESCATAIWGADYAPGLDADALDKALSSLRAKLRQVSPDADLIITRPGLGYELHG